MRTVPYSKSNNFIKGTESVSLMLASVTVVGFVLPALISYKTGAVADIFLKLGIVNYV